MILLASTSDLLRVVTGAAVTVDVHASWVDLVTADDPDSVLPGRQNTLITTATTTTIVPSPGVSTTYRTVKTVSIRNRHATTAVTVTVIHSDGTNVPELISVSLPAGYTLHYDENNGWEVQDQQGRVLGNEAAGQTFAAVNSLNIAVLAANVTNNNGTANTIADVTGLSFPVTAGETYRFRFVIWYTAAATTTGSRWSINGPAITRLGYRSQYSLTATSETVNSGLAAYDLPAASNATSAQAAGSAVANHAIVEGIITAGANGNVIARFASEVASSAITALAGSYVEYVRVL